MLSRQILGRIAVMLFATLSTAPFSLARAGEPKDTTALVAAWNIKFHKEGEPSRAKNIARGIALLDAEVIVLTEVHPYTVLEKVMAELSALGADYQSQMPTAGQNPLGIALLYKNGVQASNVALVEGSDLGDPQEYRKALAADVKIGQFDFKLLGLHLKSGRPPRNNEWPDPRPARLRQAKALAAYIKQATAGAEKDVVLLGDYNMIPPRGDFANDAEAFQALSPDGYLDFLSSMYLSRLGSHLRDNGSYGNLLDGYAIAHGHTKEFVGGSLRIVSLNLALSMSRSVYVRDVSDHLPLQARFNVVSPDDD